MIKVGKLYKTAFSEVKVDFRIHNPNEWHSDFKKHNPYTKTISPEDIFMVLEFEPLEQKLLAGNHPKDEYPFVIKVLCKEDIGYVLLRDCEIKEIC